MLSGYPISSNKMVTSFIKLKYMTVLSSINIHSPLGSKPSKVCILSFSKKYHQVNYPNTPRQTPFGSGTVPTTVWPSLRNAYASLSSTWPSYSIISSLSVWEKFNKYLMHSSDSKTIVLVRLTRALGSPWVSYSVRNAPSCTIGIQAAFNYLNDIMFS